MQVEGGIVNSDWAKAERRGEVPPIGKACDHYHRYEEDFAIAESLNLNAFRFSIEWARVEPEEGKFDEKEIEHYIQVVRALRARGMEPFVNLWHFSLPLWFSESGNFARKDASAIFARFAAKIADAFGTDVRFYITINEPLVWLGEHGKTVHATPGTENLFAYLFRFRKLVNAHKAAYSAIKNNNSQAQIGVAKHNFSFVSTGPIGTLFVFFSRRFWNRAFLNALCGFQDFVGIQYYQQLFFWQSQSEERKEQKSDIGWQIHPEGLYDVLVEAARYGVPVYVSESGIADEKDQYREAFIKDSLHAAYRAIENGVPLKGYFHWSLLDNYEFTEGFSKRFGLVAIDFEHNQTRTIRGSAKAYAEICKKNGLE